MLKSLNVSEEEGEGMNAYLCEYVIDFWRHEEPDKTRVVVIASSRGGVRSFIVGHYREIFGRNVVLFTHPMRIRLVEKNLTDDRLCYGASAHSKIYYHEDEDGKIARTENPTDEDRVLCWG